MFWITCEKCGFENQSIAVVCEHCGALLPRDDDEDLTYEPKRLGFLDPPGRGKIRCSYCWEINNDDDSFCMKCGMPLAFVPSEKGVVTEEGLPAEEEISPDEARIVYDAPLEGKVRCRTCWTDNPKGARFCEQCGAVLKRWRSEDADYGYFKELRNSTILCEHCGAEISWGVSTCPKCHREPRSIEFGQADWYNVSLTSETSMVDKRALKKAERKKIERSQNRKGPVRIVSKMIRCASCGNLNQIGETNCYLCGADLGEGLGEENSGNQ